VGHKTLTQSINFCGFSASSFLHVVGWVSGLQKPAAVILKDSVVMKPASQHGLTLDRKACQTHDCTGQPLLAGTPNAAVKDLVFLQSFTAFMHCCALALADSNKWTRASSPA